MFITLIRGYTSLLKKRFTLQFLVDLMGDFGILNGKLLEPHDERLNWLKMSLFIIRPIRQEVSLKILINSDFCL